MSVTTNLSAKSAVVNPKTAKDSAPYITVIVTRQSYGGPATLFIAALSSNWTVFELLFVELMLHRRLQFTNGDQHLFVKAIQHINPVTSMSVLGLYTPWCANASCPVWADMVNQNAINYQAVMDIFSTLLLGEIWVTASDSQNDQVITASTSVVSTNLAYTYELNPFFSGPSIKGAGAPKGAMKPLLSATEELFQNITLSLFSDGFFTPANSTGVLVTEYTIVNIYTYTWQRLAIPYGVAMYDPFRRHNWPCATIYQRRFIFNQVHDDHEDDKRSPH